MKYVTKRAIEYMEYGTSTEEGFEKGMWDALPLPRSAIRRRSGRAANPVDFAFSRGTDSFEPDKQYNYQNRVENGDRTYGFRSVTPGRRGPNPGASPCATASTSVTTRPLVLQRHRSRGGLQHGFGRRGAPRCAGEFRCACCGPRSITSGRRSRLIAIAGI